MIRRLLGDRDGTRVDAWRTTPPPDVRERRRVFQAPAVLEVVATHQSGVGYR